MKKVVQRLDMEASSINELRYGERISSLQKETRTYTRKLQEEQERHEALKIVIEEIEEKISAGQTLPRAESQPGSESLVELEKARNKLEYDLEQIIQKHNESLAQINLLKEQVNVARSERVIYSNIFKDLEKEINFYEERLKALIIERSRVD
jgi:hypothetical protein